MSLIQRSTGRIVRWELHSFPANPDLCVSTRCVTHPLYRHRGEGTHAHANRLGIAHGLGYSGILCTVHDSNEIERHILENFGWNKAFSFNNFEGEGVSLYAKDITKNDW